MRIFIAIISTGILAFVPVQLESLERSFDGGKAGGIIKGCADHAGDPKGSTTKVKGRKEVEEKINRKNREQDELRLQKYIHRSTAGNSPDDEPLTRRYTPYKHETVRGGHSTGPNWYGRKVYYSRRDFGIPKRYAMDNEEPEVIPEEAVEDEDANPSPSHSSEAVSEADEETTSESATVEPSSKTDDKTEVEITVTEKPDRKKSTSKMLNEAKKSGRAVEGDSVAKLRRKKGKKKRPKNKPRPKPYPQFHVQAGLKARDNGGDDGQPISNLGEDIDYVITTNADSADVVPEIEGSSAPKKEEDNLWTLSESQKEKEKDKVKGNGEDEDKDDETASRVGKQLSRTKSGRNKLSVRNSTPDEEVPEAEEAPTDDDGDQEVVSSEENLVKHGGKASARRKNYKVSGHRSPAGFKGASAKHSTGSPVWHNGFRGSKKGDRHSVRYTGENDDRVDYPGGSLNHNINGNSMRYYDEGLNSPLTEAAVAKILQQFLNMGRAYNQRYDARDFGYPQLPMRRRVRPDAEPLYLA